MSGLSSNSKTMISLNSWGPSGWHLIHVMMMCAPEHLDEQQQSEMMQFLVLFGKFLPCPRCRVHFLSFLERNMTRDTVRTRENLVRLMNDAHNEVNKHNNKRTFTLREHYAWITSSPDSHKGDRSTLCFIFCCFFLVCIVTKKKFSDRLHKRA